MNESIIRTTTHFSPTASLAAIGVKVKQLDLFGPIRTRVQIRQKTVKHTPADKLYDAFISLLAGAHGLVGIKTRLRAELTLQQAVGTRGVGRAVGGAREAKLLCNSDNVTQLQQALNEIYRHQSQSMYHDYQAAFLLLDVGMSGLPCGPKAAFATKGYFSGQYHRRGRQVGRVLATKSRGSGG